MALKSIEYKMSKKKANNLKIKTIEELLKKKKILFAMWNAENKKDAPHNNYYLPLKEIFDNVILFDPRKIRFKQGSEMMNKIFLDLVKKEKPDFIFLIVGRDELTIDSMDKIKEVSPKTKIIAFVGDDDTEFENLKRYQALFVDCSFLGQPDYVSSYLNEGVKNIFPTTSINVDIFKPLNVKKKCEVTFFGQPSTPRVNLLRFLIKNRVKLEIFGRGWYDYPEFKDFYKGNLEAVKVINQSKINLTLSRNRYGQLHFKGRVFEVAACKSFSLVDYFTPYLKFLKNNKEIVMFKNNEELLKKINYYLKNNKEREKIAKNAYQKTIKNHDIVNEYKKLFKEILEKDKIFSRKLPNLDKKIIKISKKDVEKSLEKIKKELKNIDYVCFSSEKSKSLKHKEYLHIYSLEKTKKQISCCDYYVSDKILGNYLLFNSYKTFESLKKKNFNKFLSLNQIVVSKNFFLKNIEEFREFFNGKEIDIINKENTCFISTPLVSIENLVFKETKYEDFLNAFQMIFVTKLYSLLNQKKILFNAYFYRLLSLSLKRNSFIIKHLYEFLLKKENWKKLKS